MKAKKNAPQRTELPTSDLTVADRIFRKDFRKVKPKRIVPGIMGRSAWFTERAGVRADALSFQRLRAAMQTADSVLDPAGRREQVAEQARAILSRIKSGACESIRGPIVFDSAGRSVKFREKPLRKSEGISAMGRPVEVGKFDGGSALLALPVSDDAAMQLDLEEVVVAEISDPNNPRLDETFAYWPEKRAVVGCIRRPGLYQAFATPKHPWLKAAFHVLCRHWRWVRFDPQLRKIAEKSGAKIGPPMIERICRLILCPPEFLKLEDPRIFGEMGVGFPPGDFGGFPGGPGGGGICERCLGGFLGELEVVGDHFRIPPVVRWCRRRHVRCSRWVSIGPFPGPDFGGIGRVTQIDVHPTNGNTLIAGAAGGGVWRSDNGGDSWRPLMELQPTLTIGAVAFAPSNPSVLYAASGEDGGGWNPAWSGAGVYRSDDGGQHWRLLTGVPSTAFSAMVVHPTDPNRVYVAGNSGLHKTNDGGLTWITNPGLASLFDGPVTDVVLAHDDAERIYIGVRADGVYRSTTGGEQSGSSPAFTRLDGVNQLLSGAASGWIKLAIGRNGANGSDFLAAKLGTDGSRIFATADGGNSWTERAQNVAAVSYDEWCSIIAVDPNNQAILYAGGAGAVMRTTNGGANLADWTSINSGVHADQQDVAFDPTNSQRIFLANDGGVYRSTDRGTNWTFASGNLRITQFYDIDIAERDRDIVAGGAQDNGVYYRNSAGVWTHIPWGDGTQVAIDPTDPNIFYFSSQNGLPTWLRRSIDGGASHQPLGTAGLSGGSPWITIIKLDPTDPIANPANNRVVFVCGPSQLFRSTDGGQNWQRVNDTSGNAFNTVGEVTALEFAPSDPRILYLGTSSGALYRASNGGATAADWTRIDTAGSSADALFPNSQIQALRVNASDPNDLWVVFGGAGVSYTSRPGMILNPLGISHLFRSSDGGVNWIDASGQFSAMSLPDVPTSAVALDDSDPDVAYAGTDVGVFRTTDGGITWGSFQDGLPRSPVVELMFNRAHNRLFAGTMGRGVYVRDL